MRELTAAESALVGIFERRNDAYKLAEAQRLEELKIVNESIQSMIAPSVAVSGIAKTDEVSAEGPADEEKGEDVAGEAQTGDKGEGMDESVAEPIREDPSKYKDFSKAAASAASHMQDKLAAKSKGKRKYDITADPDDDSAKQNADGNDSTLKKMKKAAAIDEEEDIVDTEKVSSMLDSSGYISTETWDPREAMSNVTFPLNRFGVNEEDEEGAEKDDVEEEDYLLKYAQTIVVQLSVPKGARRWSLNVCPSDHKNLSDVFLHINPRYKKQKLHLNDKQGTWGRPQEHPLKHAKAISKNRGDGLLSSDVELIITITRKAFCIYANGMCAGVFPHRRDLRKHTELSLVLGRADDNGVLEDVVFRSVWWGYLNPRINYHKLMNKDQKEFLTTLLTFEERQREKEVSAKEAAAGTADQGGIVQEEPSLRTLEVSGLPPHTDPKEIQHVEEALYGIFGEYEPEDVQIAAGVGNGYVRLPSLENTLDALQGLQGVGIEAEGVSFTLQLRRLDWT